MSIPSILIHHYGILNKKEENETVMSNKIRGKKMTVAQMKIVNKYDKSIDVNEWLFLKEEHVDSNGNKNASKNSSVDKYLNIINKNTGEIKRILM